MLCTTNRGWLEIDKVHYRKELPSQRARFRPAKALLSSSDEGKDCSVVIIDSILGSVNLLFESFLANELRVPLSWFGVVELAQVAVSTLVQTTRVVPGAIQVTVTVRDKVRTADHTVDSDCHLRLKFNWEQPYCGW